MYKFIRLIFIPVLIFSFADTTFAQKKKRKLTSEDSSLIKSTAPSSPKDIIIKYGIASYYAPKFNGRKTASGEIFRQHKFTCACNMLPFGTWVRVTNVSTGKSVIVKVNDRLHTKMRRLVDLSKAAARQLGYTRKGLIRVKLEVIGKKKIP